MKFHRLTLLLFSGFLKAGTGIAELIALEISKKVRDWYIHQILNVFLLDHDV